MDITRPIYGWRGYALSKCQITGGRGHPWPTPVLEAEHLGDSPRVPHLAPDFRCECGIYGSYDPGEASQYGHILAFARASGRVVPHESGSRAQRAQVVALVAEENDCRLISQIPAWADVPLYTPGDLVMVDNAIRGLQAALHGYAAHWPHLSSVLRTYDTTLRVADTTIEFPITERVILIDSCLERVTLRGSLFLFQVSNSLLIDCEIQIAAQSFSLVHTECRQCTFSGPIRHWSAHSVTLQHCTMAVAKPPSTLPWLLLG